MWMGCCNPSVAGNLGTRGLKWLSSHRFSIGGNFQPACHDDFWKVSQWIQRRGSKVVTMIYPSNLTAISNMPPDYAWLWQLETPSHNGRNWKELLNGKRSMRPRGGAQTRPAARGRPAAKKLARMARRRRLGTWHVTCAMKKLASTAGKLLTSYESPWKNSFFCKIHQMALSSRQSPGDFYGHPQDEHLPVGLLRGRIRIREYSNEEWCSRSHLCMSRRRWGVSWCFMLSSVRDLIMVGGLWHPWIGNPHVNLPRKVCGFFDQLNHDFRWTMRVKLQAFKSHCLHGIKSKIQEWKPPTSPALWPINA